jgi:hypothetical protein
MKNIKFVYRAISILGVSLLLTSCGISSSKTDNNEVDLKLKSSPSNPFSPLYDDIDINKNISVNKGNMDNDEVIKALMTTIFDRYKDSNDPNVAIEDYVIKKIDVVLETKKGSVFEVLYSVKGNTTRTRWDVNEQSDRWTTTHGICCSYYENENADEYVLNIIGVGPLYYKGNEDKLNTEEIAKKLFEKCYLEPRLFDGDKSSRLLSYSIDKVEHYAPGDNMKHRLLFNIDYSIQGIKGECSWICADEDGKGSLNSNWELTSIGDFYEIKCAD